MLAAAAALVVAVPTAAGAANTPNDPRGDIRPKPRNLTWQPLGPQPISGMQKTDPSSYSSAFYNGRAPYAGRVTAVTPDPRGISTAYLGTPNGGVWKTTNAGASWRPVSDGIPLTPIGSISLDPNRPDTVYAGTGEYSRNSGAYEGDGILKSVNGGRDWTLLGARDFDNCVVSDIVPNDQTMLVSAFAYKKRGPRTVGMPNPCTGSRSGVYRSTNGGRTFLRVLSGLEVQDLAVIRGTKTVLASTYGKGVWRSDDSGVHWHRTGFPLTVTGRIEIAAGAGTTVFAVAGTSTGSLAGVFRSPDAGATWTSLPAPKKYFCSIPGEAEPAGESGQCDYDLTIAADPGRPDGFIAAGVYAYRWTNNGQSYQVIGAQPRSGAPAARIHVDFHALTFGRGRLWVGNDGGSYRSDDNGATFANLNATLSITQFNAGLSGPPYAPLMGGTQDNGTLILHPDGRWWEPLAGDGGVTLVDPRNPLIRYATYVDAVLFRTTDAWQHTTRLGAEEVCPSEGWCQFYSPYAMSPLDPATIYAGTRGLFITNDRGSHWRSIGPKDPDGLTNAIGTSTTSPKTFAFGTLDGALWSTRDGGGHWQRGQGLPARAVTSIRFEDRFPGRVWASVSGYSTAHVWRSDDYGVHWIPADRAGLPNVPANVVTLDSARGVIYAGTDVGVYRSINGGVTWQPQRNTMPAAPVTDLLLDSRNRLLYAATYGRGVYRSPVG